MSRYFLILSYDGTPYNGWQKQDNTPNTVQQVMQEKMSMVLHEKIDLVGCGRTDTGVHAKNYVAHFDSHRADLIENKKHWIYKFNKLFPASIAIQDIRPVNENAHARFSATRRTYYYYLSQQKNPFRDPFTKYVYGELDFEVMNKTASILSEYTDFTSFSKLNTQNKTNNCKIFRAQWLQCGPDEWRFSITSDRFLRGMVRAIVGTLILVGRNKITINDFRKIIETKSRKEAGPNAPANALFLVNIQYPETLFIDKGNKK